MEYRNIDLNKFLSQPELEKFVDKLDFEFGDMTIVHSKYGEGTIKQIYSTGGSIVMVVAFGDTEHPEIHKLSWVACMTYNSLVGGEAFGGMKIAYEEYLEKLDKFAAEEKARNDKMRAERERAIQQAEEDKRRKRAEASYDRYKRQVEDNAQSLVDNSQKIEDKDGWIKKHIKTISASVPDFLDKWFREIFPDAKYTPIDSKRLTSGGYRMKWGLSLTTTVKTPETAPA